MLELRPKSQEVSPRIIQKKYSPYPFPYACARGVRENRSACGKLEAREMAKEKHWRRREGGKERRGEQSF